MERDPAKRLGSNLPNEVLNHAWFVDLDQDQILKKKIKPDYVPELSHDITDVAQFEKEFTEEEIKES